MLPCITLLLILSGEWKHVLLIFTRIKQNPGWSSCSH